MKADGSKLEVFAMWFCGRMEKISWKDNNTNEDILHPVQQDRKPLDTANTNGWVLCYGIGEF